ncbi:MAG: DUF58 domain-containing protein [Eubacterium sp.]|nr:DUF58 domain-containing protein [Eubacterium sp.]
MDYDFLSRIRTGITLYTKKKTSNLLDGSFRSIFRGRSLDFDDLREYSYGDNVRDIDWKASSKTGKTLIRRYIAERKHNILLIGDSGSKMVADTDAGEAKERLAVMTLGSIAYLANRHGDDFALLMNRGAGLDFSFFKSGEVHFERVVRRYESSIGMKTERDMGDILYYVAENFRRRMLIFVVTDMAGEAHFTDKMMRELTVQNDLMVLSIADAYLTGDLVYDVDRRDYEAEFLRRSKNLGQLEHEEREKRHNDMLELCKRYDVGYTTIHKESELIEKIVEMIEQHKESGK